MSYSINYIYRYIYSYNKQVIINIKQFTESLTVAPPQDLKTSVT